MELTRNDIWNQYLQLFVEMNKYCSWAKKDVAADNVKMTWKLFFAVAGYVFGLKKAPVNMSELVYKVSDIQFTMAYVDCRKDTTHIVYQKDFFVSDHADALLGMVQIIHNAVVAEEHANWNTEYKVSEITPVLIAKFPNIMEEKLKKLLLDIMEDKTYGLTFCCGDDTHNYFFSYSSITDICWDGTICVSDRTFSFSDWLKLLPENIESGE